MAGHGMSGFLDGLRQLFAGGNVRGHGVGSFGEKVHDYLARGEPVELPSGAKKYLAVDAVQTGDNPFEEEVGIQFRLEDSKPPRDRLPQWNVVREPDEFRYTIPAGAKPGEVLGEAGEYFFAFRSGITLDENIAALKQYIKEQFLATRAGGKSKSTKADRHVASGHIPAKNLVGGGTVTHTEQISQGREGPPPQRSGVTGKGLSEPQVSQFLHLLSCRRRGPLL